MTDHFLVERDGPIARLTFNRPDARNAMTFEMYEALNDACATLDADPAVRALVLRGAGDRAFASGTDIRQFLDFKTREDALGYEARLTRVLSRLAGMSSRRSRCCRATRSAAGSSSRWRAICGWPPRTRASACRWPARSAISWRP